MGIPVDVMHIGFTPVIDVIIMIIAIVIVLITLNVTFIVYIRLHN